MSEREHRATEVMCGALEGTTFKGRALAVGTATQVHDGLRDAGLDVEVWNRLGGEVLPPEGLYDRVCMRLPKGRATLDAHLHLAASVLGPEGRLWLYGANDEGIRSATKSMKTRFGSVETVDSRRHCRILSADMPDPEPFSLDARYETVEADVGGRTVAFRTLPGVFAHGRLDVGTRFLLENLRVDDDARVLDFGCGAGAIGAFLGPRSGDLVGVDIDAWAVHCASEQPGEYRVGSSMDALDGERFDHIVSNPPFHTGKDQSFQVMDALVRRAPESLVRGGRLTIVCPSTAPIEAALKSVFREVRRVADDRRFRVLEAR